MAQFVQCMRQNGVTNFPDPQNGHFVMGGDVQSNPHFHSAIQICQHYLGASGIGSGSNNGTQSAQLAFAQSDGAIVPPSASVRNSPAHQTAVVLSNYYINGGDFLARQDRIIAGSSS